MAQTLVSGVKAGTKGAAFILFLLVGIGEFTYCEFSCRITGAPLQVEATDLLHYDFCIQEKKKKKESGRRQWDALETF